jgi:hypothetical protein
VIEVLWWCWLMSCVIVFFWYLILWPVFKSVEICRTLFESLMVFKFVEICRFLVSDWTLPHWRWLWVSLYTGVHQLSTEEASFWILMGPALLIRVRQLVSSGISAGWVGVFSGGHWWI